MNELEKRIENGELLNVFNHYFNEETTILKKIQALRDVISQEQADKLIALGSDLGAIRATLSHIKDFVLENSYKFKAPYVIVDGFDWGVDRVLNLFNYKGIFYWIEEVDNRTVISIVSYIDPECITENLAKEIKLFNTSNI